MLIFGLVLLSTFVVDASKLFNVGSGEIEINNENTNIDSTDTKHMNNNEHDDEMPINDQISVLSKRLEILTEHRQEDYRMLERSLHAYVQKHLHEYINVDIKKELKDLR
jgi:septal ring factor EnvC (AmiA/AmiB activator)